jgi:hypothetical protein
MTSPLFFISISFLNDCIVSSSCFAPSFFSFMSDDGEVGVSSIDVERHMTSIVPYVLQALTEGYGVIILNPDPMQNLVIDEPEEMPSCVNSSAAIPEESDESDETDDMHRRSAVILSDVLGPAGDPEGTANTPPGNSAVIMSPGGGRMSSGRMSSGRMSYQDANDIIFPSAHQVSPELRSAGSFRKKKNTETAKSKDASNKEGRPSGSYDPVTTFGSPHGGKVKLDSKVIRKIVNSHVAVAWQYLFPRSGADNISIVGFGDAHVSVWVLFACFGHVLDANLRGVVFIAMDDAENDACSSPRPSDILDYSPRGITAAAAEDDPHLSPKRATSPIYNSATGQSANLQALAENEEAFSKLVLQKARLYEVQRLYATRCVLFAPSWWTVGDDPLQKSIKRPQILTHDPRLEGNNRSFEGGSSMMSGGKMLVDIDSHNQSQLSCGWGLASRIGAGVFCGLRFRAADMRRMSRFERGGNRGGTNNNSFASFAGGISPQYIQNSANGDFLNLYQFNTMPSCARKILAQLRGKTIPKMGTRLGAHEAKVGCVCISSGEPHSENVRLSRQVHLRWRCTREEE